MSTSELASLLASELDRLDTADGGYMAWPEGESICLTLPTGQAFTLTVSGGVS